MIRKLMETQNEVATLVNPSQSKPNIYYKNSVFQLEDQTSDWKGTKLWALYFDLPGEKVNKLNRVVLSECDPLIAQLETLGREGKIDALVLFSSKNGNFIAGADLDVIQSVKTFEEAEELSRMGQHLMNRWEDLPFPTIAGINGAALGGGLEFSLACTAMVMSNNSSARVGLPEVLLGLIPGMGGCVRLPRKVGIASALDLILTGKTLPGERAYHFGLIEACLPKENFEESVLKWAKTHRLALMAGKKFSKEPKFGGMGGSLGNFIERTPAKAMIYKKAKETLLRKTKGHYPAPLEALSVVQSTFNGFGPKLRGDLREKAMIREAQGFGRVAVTEVSRNLIRLFFMTEQVKKSSGVEVHPNLQVRTVKQAAVLGAGVMGGGIAQLFADQEILTRMKDLTPQTLTLGIHSASFLFQKQVKKKKITSRQFLQKLNRIAPVLDYSGFQFTDVVVEAIVENMDIKKKTFQELEVQIRPECIVASNTSSLSINEMQSVFQRPERFLGMHFFNPVHKMPLVEIIKGEKTSDEALATIFQLSKRLGKTPIIVKDSPGFLVNRLLMPYLNEAVYLSAEGVPILDIDRVLVQFGMPMGPMELIDEVGVDVALKVAHILNEAFGERMLPATQNDKLVEVKRLGKKSGKGIYEYKGPKKEKIFNPEIYQILGISSQSGVVADEEIVERCLLPMINEAARCLDEKIVESSSQLDLGMIMGVGFPPFRGGLLRYADSLGIKTILDRLRKYESRLGARFTPAESLLKRAEYDQKFYSS